MNQESIGKTAPQSESGPGIPVQPGLFAYPVPTGSVPVLLANRCTTCEKTFFPKRTFCPGCFDSGKMKNITLDRRGIVYAATVVRVSSPAGIIAPYIYGYVDIPADRLRVFTLFSGEDPDLLVPGREVELVLEPIRTDNNGHQIISYKFKLA
ncbi:MAG: zinc ribbon domain-containing protein [Pseudomonadota bacterium]